MALGDRPRRRLVGLPSTQEAEERAAIMATQAPRIPWEDFVSKFDWQQSEHVGLVGPNGQGKTTLLTSILPMRTYVTLFATKPRDRTLNELIVRGDFDLYHEWLDVDADKSPRRVLWPDARDIEADALQRRVFAEAFKAIYDEGNWCLAVDEGYYIASELKLAPQMRKFWTQSRSLDVSFVVGTQRPAWVPVELYDESTHLFIWRINEAEALRRLSSLGAANKEAAKMVIEELEPHQCLYINKRTGAMYRTRAPHMQAIEPDWERGESG
jgi:hypothetical protein